MMETENILDIVFGIEDIPIVGSISKEKLFQYTKTNIPGSDDIAEKFAEQYEGCSCTGNCNSDSCSCLQHFGKAYNTDKTIIHSILQQSSQPVLECGNECLCNIHLCNNRVIQSGIKKRLKVFMTKSKGCGLQTLENILPLHFVCEYAGEVINEKEAKHRISETDKSGRDNYLIVLREFFKGKELQTIVDPTYVGNIGRFINHSCEPNLIMVPVRINHSVPRLALFAKQNIIAGEELTFDYSGGVYQSFHSKSGNTWLSSSRDSESSNETSHHLQIVSHKLCHCGSILCKGLLPYDSCVL